MQRYFANINKNQVFLSKLDEHHLLHVMRKKENDEIEVVFDKKLFLSRIVKTNPLIIETIKEIKEDSELQCDITLFVCLLKGDKNEFVIQKATELGVHKIVFVNSSRVESYFKQDTFNKKMDRFNLIAKEASEQSHRLFVPEINGIIDIKRIESFINDFNFVAYEEEHNHAPNINQIKGLKNKTISIIIGPEGGFSIDEIDFLSSLGFLPVSLGHRILRAETAVVYALSTMSYLLESEE